MPARTSSKACADSARGRINPVVLQDPFHRVPRDLVTEVRQRTLDSRVAPQRILARHPHHEVSDLSDRHRAASTSSRTAVVLLGDQPPVPAEDRVRGHDTGDLHQRASAELPATHRESTALGVCEPKRSRTKLFAEDAILLSEIIDQIFLAAIHPASNGEHEELQRTGHCERIFGRMAGTESAAATRLVSAAFSHLTHRLDTAAFDLRVKESGIDGTRARALEALVTRHVFILASISWCGSNAFAQGLSISVEHGRVARGNDEKRTCQPAPLKQLRNERVREHNRHLAFEWRCRRRGAISSLDCANRTGDRPATTHHADTSVPGHQPQFRQLVARRGTIRYDAV